MIRRLVVSAGMSLFGCGALGPGPSREPLQLPSSESSGAVVRYTSGARPAGALTGGAAERLRSELTTALTQRNDVAELDGALSGTASWGLREAREGRTVDLLRAEGASRRQGFGGVVLAFIVFDEEHKNLWREQLERTPHNVPITRFGVSTSADGRFAAVVFGSVEVEYQPIARTFEVGQAVALKGRVSERFQSAQVYLTKPDGSVQDQRATSRELDVSFSLPTRGKYRLEVMGDGATGPVVLANLPLYVGVPEPELEEARGAVVSPAEAESRLLELLDEARHSAGLGRLRADAELRRVASQHSQDMAEHRFVGHVSPTSGGPDDRVRSSGLLVNLWGENVALAATPEVLHASLMSSPGHRANMLRDRFTHVGIAVTKNESGLVATYLFARRPSPSEVPASASQVEAAISELRASKGLPPAPLESEYRAAAQAGAEAYSRGEDTVSVNRATLGAMREAARKRAPRPPACSLAVELLELSQLSELRALSAPDLRRFVVGAVLRTEPSGSRLSTVILYETPTCE